MLLQQLVREATQRRKKNKECLSTVEIQRDVQNARRIEYLRRVPDGSRGRAALIRLFVWATRPSERTIHRIIHDLKPELRLRSKGRNVGRRFTQNVPKGLIPSH